MQETISPARRLAGTVRLPGDKSISHRYAMLAAIAEGTTRIRNYSDGADCQSTLGAVEALGAEVERGEGEIVITRPRARRADGACALIWTQVIAARRSGCSPEFSRRRNSPRRIFGDESLSRRPMERIMKPLAAMGAKIEARDGRFPPLIITGSELQPIDYTLPVASAQVKSCVLLAGLYAEGETVVREPMRSRDHTEIALRRVRRRHHSGARA